MKAMRLEQDFVAAMRYSFGGGPHLRTEQDNGST